MTLPLNFSPGEIMKKKMILFAGLFLGAALSAQTKPCFSMNDANNNATRLFTLKSSKGPNFWALKWTPKTTLIAQGMTVYTHSRFRDGFFSLEIWSDDAQLKQPKARLVGGTWFLPKGTAAGWYGTNFDNPQVVLKGKTYWFVWIEGGFSGVPNDNKSTNTLPLMTKIGGVGNWKGTVGWGFKCRLYCSKLDQKTVIPVGKSCSGTTKQVPTSFSITAPRVGNSKFRIEGTGVPSGAATWLFLGRNKNFKPLSLSPAAPGCWLNTDVFFLLVGKSGTGNQQATPQVGAAHHVFFPLPIPNDPKLLGVFVGAQIAVHDMRSSNPIPMVFTNGLQITIQ
jgi:hypothetical protein